MRVHGPHLRVFLDRLVPIQVRSINHLIVNTTQMSMNCASDLNLLPELRTLGYNLIPCSRLAINTSDFINYQEKDLNRLSLDKLRLPKLTHIRVKALEWKRRAIYIERRTHHTIEWLRRSALAHREFQLVRSRAGVTRQKAQQMRELAHRIAITPGEFRAPES